MQPAELKAQDFALYPPLARDLALQHLEMLQRLPLSLLPSFLGRLIDYDYRFPVEQRAIGDEMRFLQGTGRELPEAQLKGFRAIHLPAKLEQYDWVNHPAQFVEQLSAWLWSSRQMDGFTQAATSYGDALSAATPARALATARLGIAVIGKGVDHYDGVLFRRLREHGTYFSQVKPEGGMDALMATIVSRAARYPEPYGHWYVDGGELRRSNDTLSTVSYDGLKPVREALLRRVTAEIARPGMGPEALRSDLARMTPGELGMTSGDDELMDRFAVKVLTEGSGTQIFSTTFVQWTSREALRRAQPITLLARYAPRQRQRPMNDMMTDAGAMPEVDAVGSLIDADMGAWYQWISQQRLAEAEKSVFVAWYEGSAQAVVASPHLPRGAASGSTMDVAQLLRLALGEGDAS